MSYLMKKADKGVDDYYDNDGVLHSQASKSENKTEGGLNGLKGLNPHEHSLNEGLTKGLTGLKLAQKVYSPPVYPVDALGPLADVCSYMGTEMQLPTETAGQSLLAVASLLTQGLYDVETLAGVKPLSLNLLTLSESGDGKSTADSVALKKIADADHEDHEKYCKAMSTWMGLSKKEREEEAQPTAPYRTMGQGTIQGIVRSFREGISSQGSFTAEAASMLSGWGMSADQKKDTLAGLNGLWDGAAISIVRSGEGRTQLYGKRFCCHWLIQPDAARDALNDELFKTIGLWPRFIVAWPAPLKPREYRHYSPEGNEAVSMFWQRCDAMLKERYGLPEGERKVIRLSEAARKILITFWERMDMSRADDSKHSHLKPFCVRGSEQVCRIAGVLAAFENHSAGRTDFLVNDANVSDAIKLFTYSLEIWSGIFGKREDIEHQAWADALYKWIKGRPNSRATETAMLQLATPKLLRSVGKRNTAISILHSDGRIDRVIDVLPDKSQRISPNEWEAT